MGNSTGGKPVAEQWFTAIGTTADRPARIDFNGLDLLTPGVVALPDWRPETADVRPAVATGWCGVARKP